MRSTVRDAAHRAFLMLTRGLLRKTNDKPFMQEVDIRLFKNEKRTVVERYQNYGFTSVVNPEKDKDDKYPAEMVVGFFGSNRSHATVLTIDDRRARLRNMKPGETAQFDFKGQRVYMHEKGLAIETEDDQVITTRVVKKPKDDDDSQKSQAEKKGSKQDAQKHRNGYTRITQDKAKHVKEVLNVETENPHTRVTQDKDQILLEWIDEPTQEVLSYVRVTKAGIKFFGAKLEFECVEYEINALDHVTVNAWQSYIMLYSPIKFTDGGITKLEQGATAVELYLDAPASKVFAT